MSSLPESARGAGAQRLPAGVARRRWLRRLWILVALAAVAMLVDGFFIEPYRIEVTHQEIYGDVKSPLRIAFFSDVHSHGIGRRERELFAVMEREQPDIILISGDMLGNVHGNYTYAKEIYARLHAPLGVWFVRGNWENLRPFHQERAFYREAGVHFLLNTNAEARPDVWILGLDDPYTGTARLEPALAGIPAGVYTIALFHSPAYFDHLAGHVDLCLAGHTHGGQVRIPFVKPFWLPKGCGRFLAGWYEEEKTKMYVTRGIGTSIIPIRFLCRPEITMLTIEPEKAKK